MKFLYIVDHFVPFPQSEYGGIWNVVAGTEEECFDLIVAEDQDNFLEYYGKREEYISFHILASSILLIIYDLP